MFLDQVPADIATRVINLGLIELVDCARLACLSKDHYSIIQKTRVYPIITDKAIQMVYRKYTDARNQQEADEKEHLKLLSEIGGTSYFEWTILALPSWMTNQLGAISTTIRATIDADQAAIKKSKAILKNLDHDKWVVSNCLREFHHAKDHLRVMQLFGGTLKYEETPNLFGAISCFQELFDRFKKGALLEAKNSIKLFLYQAQRESVISSLLKGDETFFLGTLFFSALYQAESEMIEKIIERVGASEYGDSIRAISLCFKDERSGEFLELVDGFKAAVDQFESQELRDYDIIDSLIIFFLIKLVDAPITTIDQSFLKLGLLDNAEDGFIVRIKDEHTQNYELQVYLKSPGIGWYSLPRIHPNEFLNSFDPANLRKNDDKLFERLNGKKTKTYDFLEELLVNKRGIDAIGRPFTVC